MGFPTTPDQRPVPVQPPAAPEAQQKPVVDTTPWTYIPEWDPVRERREQQERAIKQLIRRLKQFGAFSSLSLFFYLAVALLVLVLMTPETMQRLYSLPPMSGEGTLFVITPSIVPILYLDGGALVAYFILLVLAIIVSYFYMMGESLLAAINEFVVGKPGRHSTILTLGGLFAAILTLDFVYFTLLDSIGISPSTPDFGSQPLWQLIFGFAEASVWEELISRVLLIGVPLLWIDLLFRRKRLLSPIRYFAGGKIEFGIVECALILFSAVMFGFAHVQAWDAWKVAPTIVTGLCFGYIYVKIGLYAAILFHFSFDFLDVPVSYFGSGLNAIVFPLSLLWLVAGAIFIIYYALQLGRFLNKKLFSYRGAAPGPGEPQM